MHQLFESLAKFLWHPRWASTHPAVRMLVRFCRYPFALLRDSLQGELTMRAMSLVYTTMLAMVPLIALSFSVLKAFNFHYEIAPILNNVLAPLGDNAGELTAKIIGFVNNARGAALGSVGLALLIFTVYSMVLKVEDSFNFVWQVDKSRSLVRRFSDYLSVILVAPILMFIAIGIIGTLSAETISDSLLKYHWVAESTLLLSGLAPLLLITAAFTFIYAFIPNTKVNLSAAFMGGLCGALLWLSAGALFAAVVERSSNTTAIYSTFAILFLALVWLYIGWLILLIGAKISFYVQNPQYLRDGRQRLEIGTARTEQLALAIMHSVALRYQDKNQQLDINEVAKSLRVTGNLLAPIALKLEQRGLLTKTDDERLIPGLDIGNISLFDVVDAVRETQDTDSVSLVIPEAVSSTLESIHQALRGAMDEKTLRDLVNLAPSKIGLEPETLEEKQPRN